MQMTRTRSARRRLGEVFSSRRGTIAVGLLSAAAAACILVFAIGQYKHTVTGGTRQDTVLVATGEITKGTPGDTIAAESLFKSTPILASTLSPGALSSSAVLKGSVAATDILPGEQLTAADFTSVAGVVGQLAPDQRAISVTLDAAHGDSAVLAAGDRVDIYAGLTENSAPVLTLLVQDALVIKAAGSGAAGSGASLVLGVTTAQAPLVAYTADNGHLWIVLRGAGASSPSSGPITLKTILGSINSTTTAGAP
jgi:Flp pilus assembly protein CpaB